MKRILIVFLPIIMLFLVNITAQAEEIVKTETEQVEEIELGGVNVSEEIYYLSQLIQAEAGNQDLTGKRLVADCVLNRIDQERFIGQNTVFEVINAKGQFSVMTNGAFEKAGEEISDECFEAAIMEWDRETRLDKDIVFFNTVHVIGKNPFKHQDHWFSY